ncbi:chaperone modulator CbpM [Pedobacter sp. Du54]|uniref:chaperone modulator CbpM n=1 Tax=Pedobacter anseongensis TaxID=3133439 RepID=UPI0030B0078F
METNNLIQIEHFCVNCDVEVSFINSLNEYGLIDVIILEEKKYISHEQLKDVEKAIRFYYELNINMEGIDVIFNLLKQISVLQQELKTATDRINLF